METLLAFQTAIEQLQFAKAAKILRCSLKADLRASISFLFAPLLLLTSCESVYYSLSYLETNVKKDEENDLQILYGQVLADLNQVTAVLDTVAINEPIQENPEVIQAKFLSHLIKHLRMIIVARRKMIGVYNELQNRVTKIDYGSLIDTLSSIKSQLEKKNVDHYLMAQLRDNIIYEIDVMSKLLTTQKKIYLYSNSKMLFFRFINANVNSKT